MGTICIRDATRVLRIYISRPLLHHSPTMVQELCCAGGGLPFTDFVVDAGGVGARFVQTKLCLLMMMMMMLMMLMDGYVRSSAAACPPSHLRGADWHHDPDVFGGDVELAGVHE